MDQEKQEKKNSGKKPEEHTMTDLKNIHTGSDDTHPAILKAKADKVKMDAILAKKKADKDKLMASLKKKKK